jgi:hypothetical protein
MGQLLRGEVGENIVVVASGTEVAGAMAVEEGLGLYFASGHKFQRARGGHGLAKGKQHSKTP